MNKSLRCKVGIHKRNNSGRCVLCQDGALNVSHLHMFSYPNTEGKEYYVCDFCGKEDSGDVA